VSAVIRWEDPPTPERHGGRGGRHRDWAGIVTELRGRPGVWALVAVCPNAGSARGAADQLRNGRGGFPLPCPLEAVSRTVDGEYRVYARYVGKPESAS
jgi:hypothetical protein